MCVLYSPRSHSRFFPRVYWVSMGCLLIGDVEIIIPPFDSPILTLEASNTIGTLNGNEEEHEPDRKVSNFWSY